ncbi:MAG: ATP-binding protein [Calditrichaeota bacterium]|nr:MAG: ATP-binding protein [Calditrichota bacterium]MBL1205511.1 ATP-binding protein [Calditrichota bacterium]NOG45339.1 ATP-binding protein [Calditrichota bacterium]
MIKRNLELNSLFELVEQFPVTCILGARQTGKTTLAKQLPFQHYFDLENPRDSAKLDQPQLALENLEGLIAIDEIQRSPKLFQLIRYLVDSNKNQKYLILGSASRDLIRQSSETLAGRIAYFQLGGFRVRDINPNQFSSLWLRGGFPDSFIQNSEKASSRWRKNYITTFLEQDIPQLGIQVPANTLRRFWTMLSHYHGQVLNYAELGRAFGISDMSIRKYIDILEGTFMIRVLQPWFSNLSKRIVKRPKIYFRDSGLFHSLISIETIDQIYEHNKIGASWEGFAIEQACNCIGKDAQEYYFWRTHAGTEVDLFWQDAGKNWAIEFKYSDAPRLTPSMKNAIVDLNLAHLWIIYPGSTEYKIAKNISVIPLQNLKDDWEYL